MQPPFSPAESLPPPPPEDIDLLSSTIAAPNQEVAADWLGFSSKHLRHRLRVLREEYEVENNQQLIVLASVNGWIDPDKVLPFVPHQRSVS